MAAFSRLKVGVALVLAFPLAFASTVADAQTPKPMRMTWQQALDRAAARNPSAYVAQQEILRADALVREARAGWLPILAGNGSYVRLDSARAFAGTVTTPIAQWNGNIQLTNADESLRSARQAAAAATTAAMLADKSYRGGRQHQH